MAKNSSSPSNIRTKIQYILEFGGLGQDNLNGHNAIKYLKRK
jgi:hypothetical protein